MARTPTKLRRARHRSVLPQFPAAAPRPNGVAGETAAPAVRPKNAFKLTDLMGRCAYVWWEEGAVVESDDPAFRRRILRALKKPIWCIEDEKDEFGVPWSTRVLLRPDDPRYPSRLVWRWDQIGLGDLASVGLVRRHDRQPIQTLWSAGDSPRLDD